MSYRKTHIKAKIHRVTPRKSIFKRPWFWLVLLFLAVIFTVFYFSLFYSGIQAENIIISGNKKVSGKDIDRLVSDSIGYKIFSVAGWQLKTKSIFLVNPDKLEKEILSKFPNVEKVAINKILPQTLILDISERKALGAFCPTDDIDGCFLIDNTGVAFEQIGASSGEATIVRQAFGDSDVFIGKNIVAENIISAIYIIQRNLEDNFHIKISEALITNPIRLNAKTSEGWQIYFDLGADSDVNVQLTKLNLLLTQEIPGDHRKNLRYIDLRPKDKAIICDNSICGG